CTTISSSHYYQFGFDSW
nr:immunoglobulin heavy chain junction region [Macaca mulatta]MOV53549.1 immunoglobulin heavy chain junction region [Macaca mulatta]MOV53938.1 immunoglobulin heavy chain junction region [Macaca mulatta]MOV54804.1 immunoglobulin heavy chain junction region [Macaca mulatta]MOV55154.1 immunoglobulin heavy chain junction region [Macaca mulatta]